MHCYGFVPTNTLDAEPTVTEAAEFYEIPRRTVQNAVQNGIVPGRLIGKTWVLDGEAMRLYAEVHKARRALDQYVAGLAGLNRQRGGSV